MNKTLNLMYTTFAKKRMATLPYETLLDYRKSYFMDETSGEWFLRNPEVEEGNENYRKEYCRTIHGTVLPFAYAKKNKLYITDQLGNVFKANSRTCRFSKSCGYHDIKIVAVHKYALYAIEDFVDTPSGKRIPKQLAHWCQLENVWVQKDKARECFVLLDGVKTKIYATHQNVWRWEDSFYHESYPHVVCPECGERFPDDDQGRRHEGYCSAACLRSANSDELKRMGYHTNVLEYKGVGTSLHSMKRALRNRSSQQDGKMYCGIELETYVKSTKIRDANRFINRCGYAIPTRDGSLSGSNGVEYVFRPEDLNHQLMNVRNFIDNNGPHLAVDATNSHGSSYGLHIHVSAFWMTELDKIKMVTFANRYLPFIESVGKRSAFGYATSKSIPKMSKRHCKTEDSRYHLVNTTNTATVEFRFPKSIVTYEHIAANIELCWAMSLFCAHNCSFIDLKTNRGLDKFKAYVLKYRKQYVNLANIIQPKETVKPKRRATKSAA